MFKHGETPSEEPFTRHLSPLQVANSIQSALDSLWQNLNSDSRNLDALRQSVWQTFARVEAWWMALPQREAHKIVEASQIEFAMPQVLKEKAKLGTLTHEEMFQWVPASELANAIFWAWLLQPAHQRDPGRTILLVRNIIDRQLLNAEQDLLAFGC
jgi:hypothetical protein